MSRTDYADCRNEDGRVFATVWDVETLVIVTLHAYAADPYLAASTHLTPAQARELAAALLAVAGEPE